jgi:hypothetical protein
MAQRTVSIAELRAECTTLERAVRAQGLASEEEIAPNRPGQSANEKKDARGWLRYYAVLHRFHARVEKQSPLGDARARSDAAVLRALSDEPIRVDLVTPVTLDDGLETSSLLVYQKSIDALMQAHALDHQIAWLLIAHERIENAGARGMPRSAELLGRVMDAISYAYQLLAWIMTSPGPSMPYELSNRGDPVPPAYIKALNPLDYPQIAGAAQQHHGRLAAVQALLEHKSTVQGGRRPSWSQFYGSLAVEFDTDVVTLTKFRSLGSLLASVQLDADTKTVDDSEGRGDDPAGHNS